MITHRTPPRNPLLSQNNKARLDQTPKPHHAARTPCILNVIAAFLITNSLGLLLDESFKAVSSNKTRHSLGIVSQLDLSNMTTFYPYTVPHEYQSCSVIL